MWFWLSKVTKESVLITAVILAAVTIIAVDACQKFSGRAKIELAKDFSCQQSSKIDGT